MRGMSLGRGQRGGGRVQRGGGRVQGGWGGRGGGVSRGRGGGGGWNRFDKSDDNSDNSNGNSLGCPPNITKLQYTHTESLPSDNRKGVRPEDELLASVTSDNKKKNTETFKPSHEPTEARVMFACAVPRYNKPIQTRDVIFVPDIFCAESDLTIYNKLHDELQHSGLTPHQIWSSWHGDSHLIANDRVEWSQHCPTFHMVLDKIRDYFNMDIAATR